jgi:hypothetical protein
LPAATHPTGTLSILVLHYLYLILFLAAPGLPSPQPLPSAQSKASQTLE